jgi:hypothetical protein
VLVCMSYTCLGIDVHDALERVVARADHEEQDGEMQEVGEELAAVLQDQNLQ